MVRNAAKRREKKELEFKELDIQLSKDIFCGPCSIGFDSLEDYKDHCDEEEHDYHIERRIKSLVPGVGFCAACSCLIQNTQGWHTHLNTDKHKKCIETLAALEIFGSYDKPIGCQHIGELGNQIEPTEICQKEAVKHGYGHGGKLYKWANLIGLNDVTVLGKDGSSEQLNYKCKTCDKEFLFEHRGAHLTSLEHRLKYLENFYPEWYNDINSIDESMITRRTHRVMWYAFKIENLELDQETGVSQVMRKKFFNEATQRKESNKPGRDPHRSNVNNDRSFVNSSRGGPIRGGSRFWDGPPPRHTNPYGTSYDRFPVSTGMRGQGPPRRLMERRFDGGYYGETDHSLGKRPPHRSAGGYEPKMFREDPYAAAGFADQLESNYEAHEDFGGGSGENGKAMEALRVLEEYAMTKAQDKIKKKICEMKDAVRSGVEINPSELLNNEEEFDLGGGAGLPGFPPRPMRPTMGGPPRGSFRGGPRNFPTSTAPIWGGRGNGRGNGRGMQRF